MKTSSFYILHDLPDQCSYIKRRFAGDNSIDLCNINDKICLLESNLPCEMYEEELREVKDAG